MSHAQQKTRAGGSGNRPAFGGPGFGMPVEKPKNFKGTLRRLLVYLGPRRLQLAVIIFLTILSTVFSIFSPKIMGKATTVLFEGLMAKYQGIPGAAVDFDAILRIMYTLITLYLISFVFGYIQQWLMAGVAQKTVYDLRTEVNDKLARLPLKYFDSKTHGEILSRITNDIDNISNTLQQSLTQSIGAIVTVVGIIIMMMTISPLLTIICLVTLPLSGVVTAAIAKRSQVHFRAQQKTLGELNGHVEEMFTGHKVVKAYGREAASGEEFDRVNAKLYDAGWRAQFMTGLIMPLLGFVGNIGYVFICVVGGILTARQAITIGDVQAFIQYSRQFNWPIAQLASITNMIQSTIAAAERVFELMDEVEEVPDASPAVAAGALRGEVRFQGVSFGYKAESPLIEDMNIDVKPGQVIAIVGPTGAGKTTLVNLLMRFYEIGGGKITVDGADIRDYKRGELRSKFGMVLQDTWLFNGTIRDNIAYGRPGATEEEIVWAAKAARADHFIRTLPEGYDTVLNEEASNISQGQRQLLTIARAILADPVILILDEATSSVDTRTEVHIQQAMKELMQGRTSFVIAHRLSTIRDADLILVMNHGRVIEQGTHHALLAQGGFYADLHNSQFSLGSAAEPATTGNIA